MASGKVRSARARAGKRRARAGKTAAGALRTISPIRPTPETRHDAEPPHRRPGPGHRCRRHLAAGPRAGRRPRSHRLRHGPHRPVERGRPDQPGAQLPAVGRAGQRRRRPRREGQQAPRRAHQLRRPEQHRDLRAHLREADGQRQGRPDPAALGQQRQLRRGAAGQPLPVPVPGAHRAVAPAGGDEAAVLLPAAAAAQAHDGRAGGHAQGQRRPVGGRDLRRRPVRPGELRRAEGGAGRQRHQHRRGQELPAGREGPQPRAAQHEGPQPRRLHRPDLPPPTPSWPAARARRSASIRASSTPASARPSSCTAT